jgi:calcineurin-like phosphoesterase family protein
VGSNPTPSVFLVQAMIYFTSDTHYGHKNIIKYCDRPFVDTEAMEISLRNRWNGIVKDGDIVYHLGDFALTSKGKAEAALKALNGTKILVWGNHDQPAKSMLDWGFDAVMFDGVIETGCGFAYVRHIPDMTFRASTKVPYHLCGHVHDEWVRCGDIINVGVDKWDYRPVAITQLLQSEADHDFSQPMRPKRARLGLGESAKNS